MNLIRICCLLVLLCMQPAWAVLDCNSIFPGPIQSFSSTGTLYMQGGAKVDGYSSSDVCFRQVTHYDSEMGSTACGSGKCVITGKPSLTRVRPTLSSSSDLLSYKVASWLTPSSVTLGTTLLYGGAVSTSRWDIGYVEVNGGSLSVADNYSVYVIKGITFYNNGTLTLKAGKTYIIDGDVNLSSGSITVLGSGDTHLYINGNLTVEQSSQLTGDSSLDVYVTGNMTAKSYAQIQGSYYVGGDAILQEQAVLTGRLGASNVTMLGTSKVIYYAAPSAPQLACFNDDFSAPALTNNWVVAKSGGSFTPAIVNGRLQLTQAVGNQSTSSTYQRLFPAANNLITIEFDQYAYGKTSATGADGMTVVLSDAKVTPQPGSFGGPLGYGFLPAGALNGFAGGWLGVGLDEYGNFSAYGGELNQAGKANGQGGRRPQSVVVRGSGVGRTGYNYLKGTCGDGVTNTGSCLSPAVDGNGGASYRYRLTVDSRVSNQSMIKIERNTGTGFVPLIDSFNAIGQPGQAVPPDNLLLSLTASTGGSNNIHEIDNVQICALSSNGVGTQIDHFEFDYSGSPLTCEPTTLTIRACAGPNTNTNAPCSPLITDPVTATLTPATGWVGGNPVTFSGGATQLQLRNNVAGNVTVGVTGSVPLTKPLSTTLCRSGSGGLSAAACTLNFADTGFLFDVQNWPANQPQKQVALKAVKKGSSSQVCVPAFASQSKTLNLKGSYILPAGNPFNSKISIYDTTNSMWKDIGMGAAAATPLTLAFDASGVAKMDVNYPDAGKMQLDASYSGTGSEAGLVIAGSDQFTSYPVALCVNSAAGVCNAANASCPVFKKTGGAFPLTVTAMAWEQANETGAALCTGNIGTPNFAMDGIGLGTQLVAPTGGVTATLNPSSYNHVAATGGRNSITESVNEVGVFRMTATLPNPIPATTPYQGIAIPIVASEPVGRFVPWDFNLVSGSITPACGASSYMGQPLGVKMQVQARNSNGAVTQNYRDVFARGVLSLVAANNKDGTDRSARVSPPDTYWLAGVATIDGQSQFARAAAADGPFRALHFGVKVADGESPATSFLTNLDMDPAWTGDCQGANCTAKQLTILNGGVDNTMTAYYGRLLASTGQGVASASLALPLQTQYYEQGQWQLNADDSCTSLSLTGKGILFTDGNQHENMATWDSLLLGADVSIHLGLGDAAPGETTARITKGMTQFQFSAPNMAARIPYRIVLEQEPSAPLWLLDPSTPNHLNGEAIFGSHRGNDRIITRREVIR